MIQINLSEKQAAALLSGLGWRAGGPDVAHASISEDVCKEIFRQLEKQMYPAPTLAIEISKWKHENGYTARAVEEWKRINEVMD